MKNSKYLLTLVLCFVCAAAFAQQKRISGNVWSKADGAIMMANVCEMDKNGRIVSATQTDMSGNFTLAIKNAANKLQVSYIGYQTKVIPTIGAQSTFKIELLDRHSLQEAKVTSLRKTKSNGLVIPEREMSTATQTLDMDNMQGLSFETAGEALQGQIAGLDIVANSGNLGAGTSMRLRGTSSINGNQEPLIVVDDYIMEDMNSADLDLNNPDNEEQFATLLQVNPDDIKKIEVLKDAAATAKWGSRGANGVIEITTRRGARGKTKVNFSYKFSGNWQPQGMKMLNGDGYTMMLKEAYFNPHQSDAASQIVELMYKKDTHPAYFANYNKNTDWVKEVTQLGQTHNYGVSISGGGDKAQFRVSGSYDHSTGTIIKQSMDRLTTRLALDYFVSDRIKFTSNFALTYTKNNKNYDGGVLDRAYKAMPNMSITRFERTNVTGEDYDTGEYYIMPKASGVVGLVADGSNLSSKYLADMVSNGNPVAFANLAKSVQSTYTITPSFDLEYKLLGKEDDEWQLNYKGSVWMNAYTETTNRYYPAALSYDTWESGVNSTSNFEQKNFAFTTRHQLILRPHFENQDHSLQILAQFEASSNNSTSQNLASTGINGGITDPTVAGFLKTISTGTGRGHKASAMGSVHYAFSSKYVFDVTLRADGSTRFGQGKKWGVFPGISGRWNISDEKFFTPVRKVVSMLAIRGGWGITGNPVGSEGLMYNLYSQSGSYNGISGLYPSNLRLTEIRWEKCFKWNVGANLNLFSDVIKFDFNVYNQRTTDLLMTNVAIPSSTGYGSISWCNVGELENYGWELNVSTSPVLKFGKFSAVFRANFAQNINMINEMDASVLTSMNDDFNAANGNEQVLKRVQVGNALGGIYGFRYKGVYVYDYDHNGFFNDATGKNEYYDAQGNRNTAKFALDNGVEGVNIYNAAPVARDAEGRIIYDKNGNPLPMMYAYGVSNYQFNGGDAVYEDVNHDGQINELDIQYLGSSNPKFNGGFGVDLNYGRWSLKTNFNFRVGNKIINMARMYAEDMRTNKNQSAAVNHRWRKNGQVTEIPRAMSSNIDASVYNALVSDRYVEPGDYLRFQYLQLGYSMDPKLIKKAGFSSMRFTASINNLFCWSKYRGTDPDHPQSGYSPARDDNQTPRAKSFTVGVTFGF